MMNKAGLRIRVLRLKLHTKVDATSVRDAAQEVFVVEDLEKYLKSFGFRPATLAETETGVPLTLLLSQDGKRFFYVANMRIAVIPITSTTSQGP